MVQMQDLLCYDKQLIFLKARLPICPMGLKLCPPQSSGMNMEALGLGPDVPNTFRDDHYYYSSTTLVGVGLCFLSTKYYIILFWLCLKNGMILILSGEVSFPRIEKCFGHSFAVFCTNK